MQFQQAKDGELKKNLPLGKFKTTENHAGNGQYGGISILSDNNEAVGYVKYKTCEMLMKYDSKTTGNSALQRHVERGCRMPPAAAGGLQLQQTTMTSFTTTSAQKITQQTKATINEKCLHTVTKK